MLQIDYETDLSSIPLSLAGTCPTILTWITVACGRHITTFTMIFCFSILLIALTDSIFGPPARTIMAKQISSTNRNLACFASKFWRAITSWCTYAIDNLNHTSPTILTINTITEIGLTLIADEETNASATEFFGTSIIKASASIL